MSQNETLPDSVVPLPHILVIRVKASILGRPWYAKSCAWSERVDVPVSKILEAPEQWALALAYCREAARVLRLLCGCQGACSTCGAAKAIRDSSCALVLARRSLLKAGVDLSTIFEGEEWKLA